MSFVSRFAHLITVGLVAASPLAATSAHAAADCGFPTPHPVAIDITRLDGTVVFDNGLASDAIAGMQKNHGRAFGNTWRTVGLTRTELRFGLKVGVETVKSGPSRYCARLSSVDASIGFEVFRVYLAREIKPGTCQYDTVMGHELAHVAVFRRALDAYYPRVQRRFERAAQSLGTVRAGSAKAAAERLQRRLRDAINPLFKEMNRTIDRNNARMDTPERYRHEQARCPAW